MSFAEIAPAVTADEKQRIRATDQVTIAGKPQAIGYHTVMKTGYVDGDEVYGLAKDYEDKPVSEADGSAHLCNGTDSGKGSGLDHVSILQKNDRLYMVSQFECAPGSIYMNELQQDEKGRLTPRPGSLRYVSQKAAYGGWVHCAGMTTPWQSHLGSEEYPADARDFAGNGYYQAMTDTYWRGDASLNNPYYYGWTPEVQIAADGSPEYTKHYSMGRFAHELAYVMPDRKTVYLSDDGSNVGLFMFIADRPGDLSVGRLFAVKWQQTSADAAGQANLEWVDLGQAANDDIAKLLAKKPVFADVFATESPTENGACPTRGFVAVNTQSGNECLQLQDLSGDGVVDAWDEALAARLETRRMAAYKGATTEFRKMEGITFNPDEQTLYVAMSAVAYGMEDRAKKGQPNSAYDLGGPNDIRVAYNPCGAVYALDVAPDTVLESDYVAQNMRTLLTGTPKEYAAGSPLAGNRCDVDGLANPDNLTYLPGSDILVIGEDTSRHPNDMVWAYNVQNGDLQRIFTAPFGAETTSPFWHKDIRGFGYLTVTTQHPFGEVGGDYLRPNGVETRSEVGYIGPFDFSKRP